MDGDVPALLAEVAVIGPFFAVATGPAPPGGGWVPVRGLAGGEHLAARVATVRAALRTDDRVAASIAFQGLAAQVVAPLFAAVAVHGLLPVPVPEVVDDAGGGLADVLWWRPGGAGLPGSPGLWWAGGGRVVVADAPALRRVLTALLAPPAAALRSRVSVSERVLRGNVASAVASARRLVAAAVPAAGPRAAAVAAHLLTRAPLAATAHLRAAEPPDAGWSFRRRTCCLYYRVPGGGPCDDCVLLDRRPRPA